MAAEPNQELTDALSRIFNDPVDPGALGGIQRLYRRARDVGVAGVTLKNVERFLANQRASSLHRPARKHFARNPTYVARIDQQWQADLADMSALSRDNSGTKFLLTVIDVFSKYAWVLLLKDKSAKSLVAAFQHLFEVMSHPRRPERMQTDKGKEFLNKQVKELFTELGIHHFSSWSDQKAAVVERFNRTLKTRIFTWLSANPSTRRYIDVLPKIVDSYNHSLHRTIGMAPADVTSKDETKIWRRLFNNGKRQTENPARTVKVGSKVRISRVKGDFEKGYAPNWSEEHFIVKDVQPHHMRRRVYKLEDSAGETVHGAWHREEILPIDNNLMLVEKVLRKRTNSDSGITELFVKWRGWPIKFNSWISETDLERLKQ